MVFCTRRGRAGAALAPSPSAAAAAADGDDDDAAAARRGRAEARPTPRTRDPIRAAISSACAFGSVVVWPPVPLATDDAEGDGDDPPRLEKCAATRDTVSGGAWASWPRRSATSAASREFTCQSVNNKQTDRWVGRQAERPPDNRAKRGKIV